MNRGTDIACLAPVFRVADRDRALAYHRDRLGFSVEFVHGDFQAGIEREACRIHLRHAPSVEKDRAACDAEEYVDARFDVRDARRLAARFEHAGVALAVLLRDMPHGREFYLRDPDGHVLAFVESAAP
jgi:uncharacterized glyoxalase superfamily protein PhnB